MGFIDYLLDDLARAMTARPDAGVHAWVSRCIREAGARHDAPAVRALLRDLGTTGADIPSLVQQKWVGPPGLVGDPRRLTPSQAGELIGLLKNLVRNAHCLTTYGSPGSAYLRSQRLVDRLLSSSQPLRRPGQTIGASDEWALQRLLGAGTSGETWVAANLLEPTLPLRVFKIFTHDHARHWLERERGRLAAIARALGPHRNIVELREIGAGEDDEPYLAMEYVPGGSLQDWLLEDPDCRSAIRKHGIISELVGAMAAVHRKKISHGDLRPANVLLTQPPGVGVKIECFGLARAAVSADGGLPDPEKCMYHPSGAAEADADTTGADVFALGVTWYQLLVDRLERPPYDFADVLRDAGHDTPTIAMISRCLAGPDRRFSSAVELERELTGSAPPQWPPVPKGCVDVSQIVREYLTTA